MPVLVIAGLMVFISALTASADATHFCASRPEALQYAGAMTAMLAGEDSELVPSAGRCEAIELPNSAIASRCDEFVRVGPPPLAESKPEPAAMRSGVALVVIAIVVMLGTIEVLFRCTIYERPSSADRRQAEKKGLKRTRT